MSDFSTNYASSPSPSPSTIQRPHSYHPVITRHPMISFADGTICLVDIHRTYYFNVHKGLLCRHSSPLRKTVDALEHANTVQRKENTIEGNMVLGLDDEPDDLARFLTALYDGVSELKYDPSDFPTVSSVLRLSTKYEVEHIRRDIIRGLSIAWPKTLAGWEYREAEATDIQGTYKPRTIYPHPILIIGLARQTKIHDLLPSAFYDLCRYSPSEIAYGYSSTFPLSSSGPSEHYTLSDTDLIRVLKGREYASRFLSRFIVTELEGRKPSTNCLYLASTAHPGSDPNPDLCNKRICQVTFEATTFEVLRDVNGLVFHRSSDPLFAMMDADFMQANHRGPVQNSPNGSETGPIATGRLGLLHRACEPCRMEFTSAVDAAREDMWHRLPGWFGIEVSDWP